MESSLRGLYSGFIATGPMTVFMMAAHQFFLPRSEKSPLPPATLSLEVWEQVTHETPEPRVQTLLGLGSHFAYGSGAGWLYSKVFSQMKMPLLMKGLLFGSSFWAANYLGLTPALGFRAAGTQMPARRNAMMIAAHWVWGSMLALSDEVLKRSGFEMWAGEKKARQAE